MYSNMASGIKHTTQTPSLKQNIYNIHLCILLKNQLNSWVAINVFHFNQMKKSIVIKMTNYINYLN